MQENGIIGRGDEAQVNQPRDKDPVDGTRGRGTWKNCHPAHGPMGINSLVCTVRHGFHHSWPSVLERYLAGSAGAMRFFSVGCPVAAAFCALVGCAHKTKASEPLRKGKLQVVTCNAYEPEIDQIHAKKLGRIEFKQRLPGWPGVCYLLRH